MQTLLLWVLAVYGLTAACIQLGKWLYRPRKKENACYYLLTHNSQSEIECLIRSLVHWSRLEGQDFQIYIKDSGSEDDTLPIIELLERKGIHIQRLEGTDIGGRAVPCHLTSPKLRNEATEEIVIDLREERVINS